jgi:hypothetical protein
MAIDKARRGREGGSACPWAAAFVAIAVLASTPSASADNGLAGNRDLRPAAEGGDPVAQYRLGERYYDERHRDPGRDAEALKWFRLSAAQGNAQAESRLGYVYYWGRGEPQDYVEAAMWTKRAAEHGDQQAQRRLAAMYREGKGVPVDRKEAKKWSDVLSRSQQKRDYQWIAGFVLGIAAFAGSLFLVQRDMVSGWKRVIVAAFVHVVGTLLVLNTLNTYGLPELLFPRCSYGYLAASCSYQDATVRHVAESLRNWQMVNLIFRFMAMVGFVFDALAIWYVAYLCGPLICRYRLREGRA